MSNAEMHYSKADCSNNDNFLVNTNIFSLDDDCLFHMFKFISLKDQISMVCAHVRFVSTFQMYAQAYKRKMFENDFEVLTQLEIRKFFETAGEYLETLQLPADFEQNKCDFGFTLVNLYCPNLKSLSLWGDLKSRVYFDRLRELLLNKLKLRTLRLQRLRVKDIYTNLMTESELPELEHLSIVDCNEFTGYSLKKMPNLKKLRLENLERLNYTALQDALSVMPNLYAFSYSESSIGNMNREDFIQILNSLRLCSKKLKILELNMRETNRVCVSELPKLTNFTYGIREAPELGSIDLSELLRQKADELKSLKIVSDYAFEFNILHCQLISQFTNLQKLHLPWNDYEEYSININDDALRHFCVLQSLVEFKACGLHTFTKNGLANLVRNCRNLKWVNIQCSLINNEFASELIPIIQEGGKRPNGRITFLVYDTGMSAMHLPAIYSSIEMKQSIEFIFQELRYLKSYNNFYDDFEHDNYLIQTPFCHYW